MNFRFLPSAAGLVATTVALACAGAASFAATPSGLTPGLIEALPEASTASPAPPSLAGEDAGGGWREAKKETKADEAKKAAAEKADAKKAATKLGEPKSGKPVQVGSFERLGRFLAEGGKSKTCYALRRRRTARPPSSSAIPPISSSPTGRPRRCATKSPSSWALR